MNKRAFLTSIGSVESKLSVAVAELTISKPGRRTYEGSSLQNWRYVVGNGLLKDA